MMNTKYINLEKLEKRYDNYVQLYQEMKNMPGV